MAHSMNLTNFHSRYEMIGPLVQGGMSNIYKARDVASGKTVVVKTVWGENKWLNREYEILADLAHPNIIEVYGRFLLGNQTCFTMEKVDGSSIDTALPQVKTSPEFQVPAIVHQIYSQLISGLDYIHAQGLVHGELSPQNLLVDDNNTLKIIDFEHVRRPGAKEPDFFPDGCIVGTPAYMSPEHLGLGRQVCVESDYFVVGILLFRSIFGTHPLLKGLSYQEPVRLLERLYEFEPTDAEDEIKKCSNKSIASALRLLLDKEFMKRREGWSILKNELPRIDIVQIARSHQPNNNLSVRRRARILIDQMLKLDSDLEAFCLDYFPNVKKEFSSGMQRTQKVNLLLETSDADDVIAKLLE